MLAGNVLPGGRVVFSSSGDQTRADKADSPPGPVRSLVNAAATGVFTILFPSDCCFCSAPLTKISRLPVCDDCLAAIAPRQGVACTICGERLTGRHAVNEINQPVCGDCLAHQPEFVQAAAYGSYEGGLRELIHLLKYDRVRPAASVLGRMLSEAIADLDPRFGDSAPILVPVPLYPGKLRQRGFNQSELIARAALKLFPAGRAWTLNPGLLLRHRDTESQTGLTPRQRRENMRGAFRVPDPSQVKGQDILLVDDVFTTGTTISECARTLKRAGAARVWGATVARVLKPEAGFAEPEEARPLARAAHG